MNIKLVKAFTKDLRQGNPAGVVLNAQHISDDKMQKIAHELNYSESAFVLPSKKADYKVRFFTPETEVDYCGHATIATYYKLFQLKENQDKSSLTQETKAGVFTVQKTEDGMIKMIQKQPNFLETENDKDLLATILGTAPDMMHSNLPAQVVATNVPKLIVPIVTVEALRSLKPNYSKVSEYTQTHEAKGIYCFTISEFTGHNLVARHFNPAIGIDEDPATGTAAGPLACYVDKHFYKRALKQIIINQGMWMGKSSDIYVDIADDIKVGGYATDFGERG